MNQQIEDILKQNKNQLVHVAQINEPQYTSTNRLGDKISKLTLTLMMPPNNSINVQPFSSSFKTGSAVHNINLTDAFCYYLTTKFPGKYGHLPGASLPSPTLTLFFDWTYDYNIVRGSPNSRNFKITRVVLVSTDDLIEQIVEFIFNGVNVEQNVYNYVMTQTEIRKNSRRSKVCRVSYQSPKITLGSKEIYALDKTVKIDL